MSCTANAPTVHSLRFLSTLIASACNEGLWPPTVTVQQHLSKMRCFPTPIAVFVLVIIICRLILQHWQEQRYFPRWLQPTLSALAPPPACVPGNWIIRESFTAYPSSVISWYLQWLFIYCHLVCTAQSPKGTSGSRMREKHEQLQLLLVAANWTPWPFLFTVCDMKDLGANKNMAEECCVHSKTHFSLLLWRHRGLEDEMLLLSEDRLPEPQSDWELCLDLDFPRTTTLHEF